MSMTTKTSTTMLVNEPIAAGTACLPTAEDAGRFLAVYAAWLLGCGATCIRIEKNVRRMAEAWGVSSELVILPAHIQLVACDTAGRQSHNIEPVRHTAISFNINTCLSKLSWAVADEHISLAEAQSRLESIVRMPPSGKWTVWLLASLANASFCRLFGGDGIAMLLVLLATMAGYRLKQVMLEDKLDVRVTFLCSAFFSSVIGSAGYVFGWSSTPDIALGTSVLYLIPGIPYINAASDMLDGHYICSFSRFMNAVVLTACLSLGLCVGLALMNINLIFG